MAYKIKNTKKYKNDIFNKYNAFNEIVKKEMKKYAEKKGWELDTKSDEPVFRKGNKEVYMHTDDAVIFGTINDKFEDKNGKSYAKHYHQNMSLFSGYYTPKLVKKYINQGKATLNQLDKKSEN